MSKRKAKDLKMLNICSSCGERSAVCLVVRAKEGKGADGRRFALIKMSQNCTACFAETTRAIKVIETFPREQNVIGSALPIPQQKGSP